MGIKQIILFFSIMFSILITPSVFCAQSGAATSDGRRGLVLLRFLRLGSDQLTGESDGYDCVMVSCKPSAVGDTERSQRSLGILRFPLKKPSPVADEDGVLEERRLAGHFDSDEESPDKLASVLAAIGKKKIGSP